MTYTDHRPNNNLSLISTQHSRASGDLAKSNVYEIMCLLQTNLHASGVAFEEKKLLAGSLWHSTHFTFVVVVVVIHVFIWNSLRLYLHRVDISDI